MNKTLYPDLFPETLLCDLEDGQVFTTSLKVAEHFGKQHFHVLRAVNKLMSILDVDVNESKTGFIDPERELIFEPTIDSFAAQNCAAKTHFYTAENHALIKEFNKLNFEIIKYRDSRGREKPMYRITHDGFAILAMSFTGDGALAWKIKFLTAFREMERQLYKQQEREVNALYAIRPRWKAIVQHPDLPRAQLIAHTGHKSPSSITACRNRMRKVGLLPS